MSWNKIKNPEKRLQYRTASRKQYYGRPTNPINGGRKWDPEDYKLLLSTDYSDYQKACILGRTVKSVERKRESLQKLLSN